MTDRLENEIIMQTAPSPNEHIAKIAALPRVDKKMYFCGRCSR
jgi:hypothetical protein